MAVHIARLISGLIARVPCLQDEAGAITTVYEVKDRGTHRRGIGQGEPSSRFPGCFNRSHVKLLGALRAGYKAEYRVWDNQTGPVGCFARMPELEEEFWQKALQVLDGPQGAEHGGADVRVEVQLQIAAAKGRVAAQAQ
jgi:hypothetical protein